MTLARMTIHMALAAYLSDNPSKQVVRMAKRYRANEISPSTRRSLKLIIKSPKPLTLVTNVYENISAINAPS